MKTLLTPGHHSPNLETNCLQSTSQHQDPGSGQSSTSSCLDSSHINQRKDDTTPVKTPPVYDDDTTPVETSPAYDDDKVIRPVDEYTLFKVCKHGTLDELKSILADKTIDINSVSVGNRDKTAMYDCIISSIQPVEKMRVLISSGAKLDVKDRDDNSLLHVACENGCVETVELLLDTGRVDIDSRDRDDTPIFKAILSDKQPAEKLNVLISSGAKLDVKDRDGDSLLHIACRNGCVETVEWLLNTGRVDIESKDWHNKTPIFRAIRSDKQPVEKLNLLISSGAKLDVKDWGDSLLHVACEHGCAENVELLLNTGRVDTESKNSHDETPIFNAIDSDKQPIEKLKLLIAAGAQLDVKDWRGGSLLHVACGYHGVETVELLLNTGRVDIESKDRDDTPIFKAILSDKQPVEKLNVLISSGAKLDVKDRNGNSLLHVACRYGCVKTVEWLLNTGRVDIERKNQHGNTPILVAISSRKHPVEKMRIFANCGANLNEKFANHNAGHRHSNRYHYSGDSLLHVVCKYHKVEDVEFLFSKNIDIEIRNKANNTPIISALRSTTQPGQKAELLLDKGAKLDHSSSILHYACHYGSLDSVKYFIDKGFNVEAMNDKNESPLMLAICSTIQSLQKVKVLLDAGAILDNILHYACQYGSLECVKYFIKKKLFNIESRDDNNRTPLFNCILTERKNFINKIDLLVSMNVNKIVRDKSNLSVLQFARQHATKTCVEYLIEKGFTD